MQSTATTVDAYLEEVPAERRAAFERLRALSRKIFVDAEEGIDYGMPVMKRAGVMTFAYASQKNYISLYGLGQAVIDRHKAQLKGVELGKGCIKYKKPDAIDFVLIETMMNEAHDSKHSGC
jgi:uncharacterized protein YdhG (YjbR/CyaY superfamily)